MSFYIGAGTVNNFQYGDQKINNLYVADSAGRPVEVWRRHMDFELITESVRLTAPTWAAWVDIVVLGGGGGGSGGNTVNRAGQGGYAGGFAHSTFDMIPGRDLTISIGAGGAGGRAARFPSAGLAGSVTTVSTSFNNWRVTGNAGAGISGLGGRQGDSPGEWVAYIRSFFGGAAQPEPSAAGNNYGGGGGPGRGGNTSTAGAGGNGAPGCAWIRWRSF